MIRTGAKPRRGVNLSSSGVEYESVYSQVCLYWVDVLESTYTDVFMESSRIVTCEPKCEAGGDSSTGFLPGNGMKLVELDVYANGERYVRTKLMYLPTSTKSTIKNHTVE